MDRQQIFNTVRKHLLTQRQKSLRPDPRTDGDQCAYRGTNGLKCAIGVLIPDELYTPTLENVVPTHDSLWSKIFDHLGISNDEHGEADVVLLQELQRIHDSYAVDEWERELNDLALRLDEGCGVG